MTKKNGVRDRVPSLKKHVGDQEVKKTPATNEEWLAAQLHEERQLSLVLREELLRRDQEILQLKAALIGQQKEVVAKSNEALRDTYKLTLGEGIEKDATTGEVFRVSKA